MPSFVAVNGVIINLDRIESIIVKGERIDVCMSTGMKFIFTKGENISEVEFDMLKVYLLTKLDIFFVNQQMSLGLGG